MSTDSTIMLRRNFKHTVRNPVVVFNAVLFPIVLMLMFVYVIGGAFDVGVKYVDYATPGMIVLTICYGLSATATTVSSDMTKGIINRFKVMDISRSAVLSGHVVATMLRSLVAITAIIGVAFAMGFRAHAGFLDWLGVIGLIEVLGGQEDGHAVGHQLADDVPHRAAAARIQSGRRLVQENDLGPADQRHGQIQLPAHAAGIGRCRLAGRFGQIEALQQVRDHLLGFAGAQPVEIRHQLEVLLAGQQLVHRGELAGDPDDRAHRLGLGRDVVPGYADRPAVGFHQRGQHVHRGRLARPVGAEQGKNGARADIEIDAIEHGLVPECLPQP